MNGNYTQDAQNRFFDLFDQDIETVWDAIDRLTAETQTDDHAQAAFWKQQLTAIVSDYMTSSRFFLMRMHDENVTIDQAQTLSPAGEKAFTDKLIARAQEQAGYDEARDCLVIRRAMDIRRDPRVPFTREEALTLGHALGFSLNDMQGFLLRTFEEDAGLRFNCSGDLIEAYVFLIGGSKQRADALKEIYAAKADGIPKVVAADDDVSWTQDADNSLPGQIEEWSRRMDAEVEWSDYLPSDAAVIAAEADLDMRDLRFLRWMIDRAPHLDRPSHTATHIYRELAAFAHAMASYQQDPPDESTFAPSVKDIAASRHMSSGALALLCDNGKISKKKCSELAGVLLTENLAQSDSLQSDRAKAWHYLKEKSGKPSPMGGIDQGRDRVEKLLLGEYHVEKPDMLYLLWFIANMFWLSHAEGVEDRASLLFNRLADFIDACETCLGEALLPEFYPPHLFEQSMMLSIVHSDTTLKPPAVVYEEMCASLIIPRKKKAK